MLENPSTYLKHLLGLSVLFGTTAGALAGDAGKHPAVQLMIDQGVTVEYLPTWRYEAFPESTFVRIFMRNNVSGGGGQPIVQVRQPKEGMRGHGDMKTRVEIIQGEPKKSD